MFIKQISVFIENKPGKLVEVTEILEKNGIDMRALSLADTTDFGVLRLIVNDPDKAREILRAHDYIVKQTDVIAALMDDRPGGLHAILKVLNQSGASVEYMYAFMGYQHGQAVVVMRTDSPQQALDALAAARISVLDSKDVCGL